MRKEQFDSIDTNGTQSAKTSYSFTLEILLNSFQLVNVLLFERVEDRTSRPTSKIETKRIALAIFKQKDGIRVMNAFKLLPP